MQLIQDKIALKEVENMAEKMLIIKIKYVLSLTNLQQ
jgi:hypothetical protein